MRNVSAFKTFQPLSCSLVLPPAQTGSCWASGTGAVGREGGGTGEHRGDWRETVAPLTLAFSSLFWKGGFSAGKTTLYAVWQMYHLVQIFVFFEVLDSFLTNMNPAFYYMHVLTVLFYWHHKTWIINQSRLYPQTHLDGKWSLLSALFKKNSRDNTSWHLSGVFIWHAELWTPVGSWITFSHVTQLTIYSWPT